nr:NAD-dependent epimerase/dehydratase family protein [Betaproteobacteria bacterium]
MDKKHVGLLGATSLVGECLQQQFSQNHWHISAFSRQQITQSHAHITWQKLDSASTNTNTNTNIHSNKEEIVYWVCAAPIWTLPEHFNLLLTYGIKRIIILSSTSRFTKLDSSDRAEQNIAQQLTESENQVQAWADAHQIEWIILRPTLIYGYGRDKNITEITRFIYRFGFFPVF